VLLDASADSWKSATQDAAKRGRFITGERDVMAGAGRGADVARMRRASSFDTWRTAGIAPVDGFTKLAQGGSA
jgi:hypothetical protein